MISELADIVFPAPCLACGKPPKPLCISCEPTFRAVEVLPGLYAATELNEKLNILISSLKDKNRTALFTPLSKGLRIALEVAIQNTNPSVLVCPPSSKRNFRKRGFNPAFELLKRANPSRLPVTQKALKLRREPEEQRLLDAKAREKNTDGIFESRLASGRVLLVDDVRTTGATLLSATNALERAGVEVVGSCVLAQRI